MPLSVLDYNSQYFPLHKSKAHKSYYPIITNVAATSLGLITWTTDVLSTSQVFYGRLPLLGDSTPRDSTLVTSHSVQLTNLVSGAYYYYRVLSFNQDSLSISHLHVFQFISVAQDLLKEDGTFILLEDGTKIQLES